MKKIIDWLIFEICITLFLMRNDTGTFWGVISIICAIIYSAFKLMGNEFLSDVFLSLQIGAMILQVIYIWFPQLSRRKKIPLLKIKRK